MGGDAQFRAEAKDFCLLALPEMQGETKLRHQWNDFTLVGTFMLAKCDPTILTKEFKKPKFMMWFSNHIYPTKNQRYTIDWHEYIHMIYMIVVTLVIAHSMWLLEHLQIQETNVAYTNCLQIILALLNSCEAYR